MIRAKRIELAVSRFGMMMVLEVPVRDTFRCAFHLTDFTLLSVNTVYNHLKELACGIVYNPVLFPMSSISLFTYILILSHAFRFCFCSIVVFFYYFNPFSYPSFNLMSSTSIFSAMATKRTHGLCRVPKSRDYPNHRQKTTRYYTHDQWASDQLFAV